MNLSEPLTRSLGEHLNEETQQLFLREGFAGLFIAFDY